MQRIIRSAVLLAIVAGLAGAIWYVRQEDAPGERGGESGRVAVEVTAVERGRITDVRELTGSLEAENAFTVAPNISGRIERIHADIGDTVEPGEVLVELDDDEPRQNVAEAEAALSVARAELDQAQSEAELARREYERTRALADRNLSSQSELDTAEANAAVERARVEVAEARVTEREAALAAARVRLSYTQVRASWPEEGAEYVVGERMVSRGDSVSSNEAMLGLLSPDPLKAVVFASQRDYPALSRGQPAQVYVDALPGERFDGEIRRLAPRFDVQSRQARVEVEVPNPDGQLAPGMFTTVRVETAEVADARLVPIDAVTELDGETGVYQPVAGDDGMEARFVPVQTGIESDTRIEIREPALDGRVITLGLQLLEDGAPIRIANDDAVPAD